MSNVFTIIYCELPGKDPIKVTSEEIFQSFFPNGELCPSTGPVNYSNPLDFPFGNSKYIYLTTQKWQPFQSSFWFDDHVVCTGFFSIVFYFILLFEMDGLSEENEVEKFIVKLTCSKY